jgi:1-acyl-sn-glycerol-3-phosphate acyltransferase
MFYKVIHALVSFYLRLFNRWEITGEHNIPESGPVVLVANHISLWDPPFLACSIRRPVHFMAKEELFNIPLLGRIIKALGAFPVKRGKPDRNALRLAAKYLENGEILGLFPEGTRSKSGELLQPHPGAALFALRSGAPIVPVGLIGTRTTFPLTIRGNVRVKIGEPVVYPELYNNKITNEDLERVSAEIMLKVKELLEEK